MARPAKARVPLATSREVAEYLNISVRTLDDLAYRRVGPAFVRVGRYRRYRWADVERYLAERTQATTPRTPPGG